MLNKIAKIAIENMSKAMMRRASSLAKHIIKQVTNKKYDVTDVVYLRVFLLPNRIRDIRAYRIDAKPLFNSELNSERCSACAIGSIFRSLVMTSQREKFIVDIDMIRSCYFDDKNIRDMKKVFSAVQLEMIESAFMRKPMRRFGSHPCTQLMAVLQNSAAFGSMYLSNETRLVAIMENVIENHGVFIPDGMDD